MPRPKSNCARVEPVLSLPKDAAAHRQLRQQLSEERSVPLSRHISALDRGPGFAAWDGTCHFLYAVLKGTPLPRVFRFSSRIATTLVRISMCFVNAAIPSSSRNDTPASNS